MHTACNQWIDAAAPEVVADQGAIMQGCARPDGALGLLHSAEAACKAALGLGEWKASGLDDEVEGGAEAPKRHLK